MMDEQAILKGLRQLADFRKEKLADTLKNIEQDLIKTNSQEVKPYSSVFWSALEMLKHTAQLSEIVHATGIISCLPKVLTDGEVIESLSLGAGSSKDGFDLKTNKRIAEFKFARWQNGGANGMRKRHVFADLVKLYLEKDTTLLKQLYVFEAEEIRRFLETSNSEWKNQLSRHGKLKEALSNHLKGSDLKTVKDIYAVSGVTLHDIKGLIPEI